jgi:hypothetical protein
LDVDKPITGAISKQIHIEKQGGLGKVIIKVLGITTKNNP